jgi:TolB protein
MDAEGGNQRHVTQGYNAAFNNPSWSPSGDRLVMGCNDPDNLTTDGLCFINANGSGFEFYPLDDLDVGGVEWSPDGTRVLFTVETQSVNEDIFVLDLNTGNYDNITETGDDWEHLTWSPDGTKIAFVGSPILADVVSLAGLYVIDPDGSNRERLFTPGSGAAARRTRRGRRMAQNSVLLLDSDPGADEMCIVDANDGDLIDVVSATNNGYLFNIAAEPD